MFKQLLPLIETCTSLTIILVSNKDGTISATVLPKSKQAGDDAVALSTPLSIKATADELDAQFAQVLGDYVNSHQSLAEQLENTKSILDAAKAESQKKATTAISKASTKSDTPKTTKAVPSDDGGDGNDDGDDENGGVDESRSESTSETSSSTTATAPTAEADLWG